MRAKGFDMGLVAILETPEQVLSYASHPAHLEYFNHTQEIVSVMLIGPGCTRCESSYATILWRTIWNFEHNKLNKAMLIYSNNSYVSLKQKSAMKRILNLSTLNQ